MAPTCPGAAELPDEPSPLDADPLEVRDALGEVAALLSPQERAAVVLKDVFDFPLAEFGGILGTPVGGSLHHTLVIEDGVRYHAEVRTLDGNRCYCCGRRPSTARRPEAVSDVVRVETADRHVVGMRSRAVDVEAGRSGSISL